MAVTRQRPTSKWWDTVLCVLASLVLAGAWLSGLATNAVTVVLMTYVPIGLILRVWWAYKKTLATGFIRQPFSIDSRWYLFQCLGRWVFLAVWLFVLRASIIPLQLGREYKSTWTLLVATLILGAGLQLLPNKRILLARNIFTATVTLFFAAQLFMAAGDRAPPDAVLLDPPFRAETYVFQGGRSPLLNHHFILRSQRHALDLLVLKNGMLFDGNESDLSAHGCWGRTIHAPASGRVAKVVDDRPDVPLGKVDRKQIVGNHVVLEIAPSRYVLFAHLRQRTSLVRVGDHVECGQPLAQCGNSGNTSAPHLHLQVQSRVDVDAPGVETFPMLFRNVTRVRDGASKDGVPVLLRRSDRLINTEGACSEHAPKE
jgi:hypothetical protein